MNILCKIKLHRWKYKTYYNMMFSDMQHVTRYCERCEKIEKALLYLPISAICPPIWESIIPKKKEVIK